MRGMRRDSHRAAAIRRRTVDRGLGRGLGRKGTWEGRRNRLWRRTPVCDLRDLDNTFYI
jgi:hypothetical protein